MRRVAEFGAAPRAAAAAAARSPPLNTLFRRRSSPAHAHADKPSHVELVVADGADGAAAPSPLAAPAAGAFAPPSGGLFGAAFFRALRLDPAALAACREPLRAAVELGTIVLWFYVADRTPALGAGPKRYIRDVFLSIFVVLSLVAGAYTTRPGRAPVAANRAQTEEWKGWMQVGVVVVGRRGGGWGGWAVASGRAASLCISLLLSLSVRDNST